MKKYCDFLGNNVGIKYENSSYYKSNSGALFSIFITFFCLAYFIIMMIPLINKENAKVNMKNIYEDMPNFIIFNKFSLALNILNSTAFPLDNFRSYYNVTLINYFQGGSEFIKLSENQMEMCKQKDLLGRHDKFQAMVNPLNISQYFCLDINKNLEIQEFNGPPKVNYMAILINRCENRTGIICKSNQEIDTQFQNSYIQLIYSDYYFDFKNFSEPGQVYFRSDIIPFSLDSQFYKKTYMYFNSVEYLTDTGLFFEEKISRSYFRKDSIKEQVLSRKDAGFPENILSEIFITATPLKYEYHRSYNKLHKIIAELGGLINFFTIIFSYLNNFLNEKIFNLKIVYDVFNLEKKKEINTTAIHIENTSQILNHSKISYKNKLFQESSTGMEINKQIINLNKNYTTFSEMDKKLEWNQIEKNIKNSLRKKYSIKNISNERCHLKNKFLFNPINCIKRYKSKKFLNFSEKVLNSSLDIRRVIMSINEIEIVKNIIFDENQLKGIFYLSKNHFMINDNKYKDILVRDLEFHMNESDLTNKRFCKINAENETKISYMLS